MLATSPALARGLGLSSLFNGIAHAEEDLIAAADQAVNVLEFEAVVPVLLKDFPLNEKSCNALRKSMSKEAMKKSFAVCPTL